MRGADYIQTIGLAAQFPGVGYGTRLMAFAEQRIWRDHQNVFLCVSSFNQAARRFYQRLGHQQVGELSDFLVAGRLTRAAYKGGWIDRLD